MKIVYKIALLLSCWFFALNSYATDCAAPCQLNLIDSYFKAIDNISRQGSSVEDIDSLLALTHDKVEYVHVEYEANFTKLTWRQAFLSNLKRGAYQNTDKNQIRILNTIYGKNHTAIEYSHGVLQEDGSWQASEPLLVVFGFTEQKISLVKELW